MDRYVKGVLTCLLLLGPAAMAGDQQLEPSKPKSTLTANDNPLVSSSFWFEENRGQTDARAEFIAHTRAYSLLLTRHDARLARNDGRARLLTMSLEGAGTPGPGVGVNALSGATYYVNAGRDPIRAGSFVMSPSTFSRNARQARRSESR